MSPEMKMIFQLEKGNDKFLSSLVKWPNIETNSGIGKVIGQSVDTNPRKLTKSVNKLGQDYTIEDDIMQIVAKLFSEQMVLQTKVESTKEEIG